MPAVVFFPGSQLLCSGFLGRIVCAFDWQVLDWCYFSELVGLYTVGYF